MRKLGLGSARILPPGPIMSQEDAFALADVVITDISSGALSDTIFMNKKAVAIARKDETENLLLPALVGRIPICLAPDDLLQKVQEALATDFSSPEHQQLRTELFDSTGGADAARAAHTIFEFVADRRHRSWSMLKTDLRWRKGRLKQMSGAAVRRVKRPMRALLSGLRGGEPFIARIESPEKPSGD